ncbi:MAG: apolipoprotein N-acyltransferase [Buchnera aphidicola (Nurudea yanoniella)]
MFLFKTILSILSGGIGVFSFSPWNYWPCSILSLVGLQFFSNKLSYYKSGIIGFFWGIGLFGFGINWMYSSINSINSSSFIKNDLLVSILIIYLSIYPLLFCIILNFANRYLSSIELLFFSPSLWHILEYIRKNFLTGFPWLELGYSQIDSPLKNIGPILGVEGITFILMILSYLFILSILQRKFSYITYFFLILVVSHFLYKIPWYKQNKSKNINIALIQTNIPQTLNWNTKDTIKILESYAQLIKKHIKKNSIIILPESAIPNSLLGEIKILNFFKKILQNSNNALISGYIKSYKKNKKEYLYNTIIVFKKNKKNIYNYEIKYKKHHLVPFSENILFTKMFLNIFNISIFPFSSGPYIQFPIKVKNFYFSSSICYEIIFGEQIRDNFFFKSDFLLSISNDVWFGKSVQSWQHFQMARMRALELGRPLIHSSNNGITAIVNANGTINSMLPRFQKSILQKCVTSTSGTTPYSKLGNIPIWIITIIFVIYSLIKLKKYNIKKL